VTLSGALSTHRAGENAEILAQPCGQPSATKVAPVTTTTGGKYSAQVQPLKNTIYTVKVQNSTSKAVSVKVRPRLRLRKVAPHRYSLRVFAAQSFAGKSASFQRYSAALRRWVVIRRVVLRRERVRHRANRDLVGHVQVKRPSPPASARRARANTGWLLLPRRP